MPTKTPPFRTYFRVQIREGEEEAFLNTIPRFTEISKKEPATQEINVYYHEPTRMVVFLESFDDADGLLAHFANPEIHAIQPNMIPHVDFQISRFFGDIPDAMRTTLDELNYPYEVIQPWPGTHRLDEAPPDIPGSLQSSLEMTFKDMTPFRNAAAEMEAAVATFEGVWHHQTGSIDAQRAAILATYANQDDFLTWATSAPSVKIGALLNDTVETVRLEILGKAEGEAKAFLDQWGALYFTHIGGFSRFGG